jgi:cytidylate kinase
VSEKRTPASAVGGAAASGRKITTPIAIDGPAASGKGTLARRVAEHLGFDWLDTGLLYRAVALSVLDRQLDPIQAATILNLRALGDPRLRDDAVAQEASRVAAIPEVRAALLAYQRGFAERPPGGRGAVLDGRDVGTVVCPGAPVKLFVTADLAIRAQRRLSELHSRGVATTYSAVLEDLQQRDARDSQRAVAPLRPAEDAFVLDTSALDADQALAHAIDLIERRSGSSLGTGSAGA